MDYDCAKVCQRGRKLNPWKGILPKRGRIPAMPEKLIKASVSSGHFL